MALNTALKLAILTSGKTQTTIAREIDITESRLSRIVHGHEEATDDEKKLIAKAVRRPKAELFQETAA